MVLNKEKSKDFKKINSNTKFKKGLFVSILLISLLLSGCVNKANSSEEVNKNSSVAIGQEQNTSNMKVYQPGEHRVFYSVLNHYSNINEEVCTYPEVEIPNGYELVDTEFAMYFASINSQIVVIYEFVNNVPVVAQIVEENSKIQKTSFGTPVENKKAEEINKTLTKNLQ